jgi:hypothetical protein
VNRGAGGVSPVLPIGAYGGGRKTGRFEPPFDLGIARIEIRKITGYVKVEQAPLGFWIQGAGDGLPRNSRRNGTAEEGGEEFAGADFAAPPRPGMAARPAEF